MKIAILGYSGSGKSTLAKYLGTLFSIPVLYLDTVQFEENWQERDRNTAIAMVAAFMQQNQWVIDGNYTSFLQKERLEQADYIIYLAFSRWSCLLRAVKRYRQYKNTCRESMAAGCKEKIDREFVWWILYQGRTKERRQHVQDILEKYPTKSIVIKNQKQLNAFMQAPFSASSAAQRL